MIIMPLSLIKVFVVFIVRAHYTCTIAILNFGKLQGYACRDQYLSLDNSLKCVLSSLM